MRISIYGKFISMNILRENVRNHFPICKGMYEQIAIYDYMHIYI